MSDGGKGSAQRPKSVADNEWASRWNATFGRDKEESFIKSVDADKYQQNRKEEKDGQGVRSGDLPEHIHLHSD